MCLYIYSIFIKVIELFCEALNYHRERCSMFASLIILKQIKQYKCSFSCRDLPHSAFTDRRSQNISQLRYSFDTLGTFFACVTF